MISESLGRFLFEDLSCVRLTARAIETPQVVRSLPRPGDLARTANQDLGQAGESEYMCILPSSVGGVRTALTQIAYEMNTTVEMKLLALRMSFHQGRKSSSYVRRGSSITDLQLQ